MNQSAEIGQLATALAKAQAAMTHAAKSAENPHFRSKYADLAAIIDATRGPLSAHGLSVVQLPFREASEVGVVTRLLHASGEWIESRLTVTVPQTTAQAVGSALTYCRRYAWQSITGIAADEDDDGTAASGTPVEPKPAAKPRTVGRETKPTPQPTPDTSTASFTINGKTHTTAGIGRDDALRVWTLSAMLEKAAGRGTAKEVMMQTANVDTSLKLTAATGKAVIAALREACGAAGVDPDAEVAA